MQSNRILGFDAIRAVSVLLVIASHVGIVEGVKTPALVEFFSVFNASFGVRCFFVLSGFLITTLLIKEYDRTGTVNVAAFMLRRALRILPLYFVILLSILPFFIAGRFWQPLETLTYAVFFAYNYVPTASNIHYLSHLWSLGVEEQFYIIWPVIFTVLASRKSILIAVCSLLIGLCYWRMISGFGDEALAYAPNRWTIPAIYPIALGAMLSILISDRSLGALTSFITSTWLCLLASLFLIALPAIWQRDSVELEVAGALGITLLIGWIYANQDSRVVKALEWKPLSFLGMISYGLYMWQGVLTGNGPYRSIPFFPPDPLIGAVLTFPVAIISWYRFEQPILRMRSKFRPLAEAAE